MPNVVQHLRAVATFAPAAAAEAGRGSQDDRHSRTSTVRHRTPPGPAAIRTVPDTAKETLHELAPRRAEESIDVDGIEVPESDPWTGCSCAKAAISTTRLGPRSGRRHPRVGPTHRHAASRTDPRPHRLTSRDVNPLPIEPLRATTSRQGEGFDCESLGVHPMTGERRSRRGAGPIVRIRCRSLRRRRAGRAVRVSRPGGCGAAMMTPSVSPRRRAPWRLLRRWIVGYGCRFQWFESPAHARCLSGSTCPAG